MLIMGRLKRHGVVIVMVRERGCGGGSSGGSGGGGGGGGSSEMVWIGVEIPCLVHTLSLLKVTKGFSL